MNRIASPKELVTHGINLANSISVCNREIPNAKEFKSQKFYKVEASRFLQCFDFFYPK